MELVLLVVALILAVATGSDTRPNIIFIFADDWGWNDVSYNGGGYLQTDFLDSLAQDGLILSQHYVLPTCTPSRAALLTGRYPSNIGMQHSTISPGDIYGVPLDTTFVTEELKSYGYSTHMIGKWHLGYCAWEYTPLYRGFDSFSGFFLGAEGYETHNRSVGNMNGFDLRRGIDIVEDADGIYSTYWHYSELSNLLTDLQDTSNENPFFIYLAWQNSHNPPEAPKSYLKQYKEIAKGARWFFMGQTAVLDDVMEDFIVELKEKNLWDNTLIVFSSDNGGVKDSGDNAPLRGAKSTLWEGAVRVPAFVTGGYLPENMRGQTTNEMIHVTDWFSTFLSLASTDSSYSSEVETDGFDISKVILQGEATARDEFLINVDKVSCESEVCGALRYQNYKIIMGAKGITSSLESGEDCFWTRNYMKNEESTSLCGTVPEDIDTTSCGCNTKPCLFDLEADPCEYYDLADNEEYKDLYEKMFAKLKEYYDAQVHPWKDIFASDYDNADPSLHNDFWSPWIEKEQLLKTQNAQKIVFETKMSGNSGSSNSILKSLFGKGYATGEINVLNDTPLWMGIALTCISIILLYLSYRCNWICCKILCCKLECCECCKKGKDKENKKEKNPLLGSKSSRYT